MNIVYKIVFTERRKRNDPPFYYIGSKSNCVIRDGLIYDTNSKSYWGSSTHKEYKHSILNDNPIVEILGTFDSYIDALKFERNCHIENDVVASIEYFNLSIATISIFTVPGHGCYVHPEKGVIKLPIDHPDVLSGKLHGVMKGRLFSDEHRSKIGRPGKANPFYGKTHTSETKKLISIANTGKIRSDEVKYKMSIHRRGVKKSASHREKIGRKGYLMLKNIHTNECVRIKKCDIINYDLSIWKNPFTIKAMTEKITRVHSEETKSKIGRKGYIMLKNIHSGESIRILKSDVDKYDKTVWMNPATVKKLLRDRNTK